MTGGPKSGLHAMLGAGQDVAAGAHGPADQHWLPSKLESNEFDRTTT